MPEHLGRQCSTVINRYDKESSRILVVRPATEPSPVIIHRIKKGRVAKQFPLVLIPRHGVES